MRTIWRYARQEGVRLSSTSSMQRFVEPSRKTGADNRSDQGAGIALARWRRRRMLAPIAPKPSSIMAHVEGSGTAELKLLMVSLPAAPRVSKSNNGKFPVRKVGALTVPVKSWRPVRLRVGPKARPPPSTCEKNSTDVTNCVEPLVTDTFLTVNASEANGTVCVSSMAKLKLLDGPVALAKSNRIVAADADVEQTADPISRLAASSLAYALISTLLLTRGKSLGSTWYKRQIIRPAEDPPCSGKPAYRPKHEEAQSGPPPTHKSQPCQPLHRHDQRSAFSAQAPDRWFDLPGGDGTQRRLFRLHRPEPSTEVVVRPCLGKYYRGSEGPAQNKAARIVNFECSPRGAIHHYGRSAPLHSGGRCHAAQSLGRWAH